MSDTSAVKSLVVAQTIDHSLVFHDILALDTHTCIATVYLASVISGEAVPRFERLPMMDTTSKEFCRIIDKLFKQYQKDLYTNDLLFPEYADESLPAVYEIEHIDLSAYHSVMEQINPLSAATDIDTFGEDQQFVSGLRFYVIAIQAANGEPVYFFRLHTAKKVLNRSSSLALWRNKGSYDRITQPIFLFDEEIDCMSRGGLMFIFNKSNFQTLFRFFEEVRQVARQTLETINIRVPIHNFEEFVGACEGHLVKLRKLKNIAEKPYMSRITIAHVRKVIEDNKLPVKIVEVGGEEKILYDPKAKDKWVLLRVLDDDYLKSMMTEQVYEVTGKRQL